MADKPTPPTKSAEHLRGPWQAFIADRDGFVYDSVADALENIDDPDDEIRITVVRGSARPNDRSGDRLRLPGSSFCGDKAYELDDVYLADDDESVSATARFAQALAMAAGLNAAGGAA
jgi:hypothetical protein